ncbi:Flp family type IVb pilin [Methylorubrum populi]
MGSLFPIRRRLHGAASSLRAALSFARHEGGATAIEYGLVCAFMALAAIGGMRILGDAFTDLFPKVANLFPQ